MHLQFGESSGTPNVTPTALVKKVASDFSTVRFECVSCHVTFGLFAFSIFKSFVYDAFPRKLRLANDNERCA